MREGPNEVSAKPVLLRGPVLLALGVMLALVGASVAFALSDGAAEEESGLTLRAADGSLITATEVPEADAGPGPALHAGEEPFEPLSLTVSPAEVGVGETMLVRAEAPGAVRGVIEVLGRTYPLVRERNVLWAVVGVPLETEPGDESFTLTTFDAAGEVLEQSEGEFAVVEIDRPVSHVYLTPEQDVRTPEAEAFERQLRIEQFVTFDRPRQWDEPWIVPAEGWETTPFGEGRSYNDGPVSSYHLGLDIGNDEGTPIVAPAPGRVAWVGEMPMRGLSVIVDHGAGVVSGYHHLVEWSVERGDQVDTGDLLGLMGTTGLSTGPHLHWEILVYGVNVDPATWMEESFTP